ncbi:uncharacterized protein ACA1_370250 [Acanthamoeba castellanii str. Neff]|uniref:Uncharacterized protein n=1 Tax=Acanthamoeba castellanii (strain ATCC 30010 / Neff) TaxID=1257118 RepID=L8H1K4_ACACF|nr:uncharacterized protein ACA1_370250 [Acanthamoeba castellanii str. Neff]ELR18271.1 hypothetical protein ACA1_370250 [Acanthamoeba castellanii str. Neff]
MYLYCSAVSPVGDFKVFFQHRLGNLDRSGLQALISSPYLRQRQSSQDVEDGTVFHCSATRKGTGPIDVSLVKAPNLTCYHIASQPVNFYTHQTQAPCASKLRLKYVFLVGSKLVLVGEFPKKVASTRVVECVIQGSSGAEVIEVPKSSSTWTRQMITLKLPPTWDLPLDPSAHIRYTFHDHTRATSEARPIHLTLEL